MTQLEAINQALFLQLNATEDTAPWLINSATVLADYLIYLIPILLIWMWLFGGSVRRGLAIEACVAALLGLGINQLIAAAWQHPRPFMIGLVHAWLPHAADSSFPSDHMTIFTCLSACFLLGKELWLAVITLSAGLAVGWARVFLGVHFPFDIFGAIAVAVVVCAVVAVVWKHTGESITRFAERIYRKIFSKPIAIGWIRP